MSRRVAPSADRAAQNAQTIKALLKLEANKVCADCKRNKHPRWASWNIGVFVCIRCSGIHRGMGTHISRVKSVDLDSWTDEQLQNILKWGNARANKYWEAKLAAGHQPSEAKIENFIRTKYDTKRWVMDGPIPDPSTLDAEGDDDVPLTLVQEKAKIERSTSQQEAAVSLASTSIPKPRAAPRNIDLFGDDSTPPLRPNSADIISTKPSTTVTAPAPKPARPTDSLFGIDFFGGSQPANTGRPSSAASNPTSTMGNSRTDLKSSILSLYASAPKPTPQPQPQQTHNRQTSFGTTTSPTSSGQDAFGGLTDAFSTLSFPSNTTSQPRQPSNTPSYSAFNGLTNPVATKSTPPAAQVSSPSPLAGGGFFDSMPAKSFQPQVPAATKASSNGLDFSFASAQAPAPPQETSGPSQDLFASDDFAPFSAPSPAPLPVPPPTMVSSPALTNPPNLSSPFNLSSSIASKSTPAAPMQQSTFPPQPSSSMSNPWGGMDSNAWAAPEPEAPKPKPPTVSLGSVPSRITPNDISGAWGAPITSSSHSKQTPTVTGDEDFGGWTEAASPIQTKAGWGSAASPTLPKSAPAPKPTTKGFGGASDPYDNPWG